VKALLANPLINPNQVRNDGRTPILIALVNGHINIIHAILENAYFQKNKTTHSNQLWALLKQPETLKLDTEQHKALLESILGAHRGPQHN
jgi:hypothetical protein